MLALLRSGSALSAHGSRSREQGEEAEPSSRSCVQVDAPLCFGRRSAGHPAGGIPCRRAHVPFDADRGHVPQLVVRPTPRASGGVNPPPIYLAAGRRVEAPQPPPSDLFALRRFAVNPGMYPLICPWLWVSNFV